MSADAEDGLRGVRGAHHVARIPEAGARWLGGVCSIARRAVFAAVRCSIAPTSSARGPSSPWLR
eukprot:7220194-Pyramimonas_sp.AAC.2